MKPYNHTDSDKSEEVREMFDRIAPKYDLLNHTLSANVDRLWRRRVMRIVRRRHPRRILDVATGTGDLALLLARRLRETRILGLDPSEGMLAEARRKIAREGLDERITLQQGSAEKMPEIADATFDAVTVAFGVRNFGDAEQGLREMLRTLKPGGQIVILEFSTPTGPLIGRLYRWYSHTVLPRIGGIVSKDRSAYEYLPASVDEFPSPDRFLALMEQTGYRNCRARSLSFGIAQIYTAER